MNFVPSIQKFFSSILKKIFTKGGGNGRTNSLPTDSEKFDQKMVYNLAKRTLPSYSQLKTLPQLLSQKEKRSVRILSGLIGLCLLLLLSNFYFAHAILIPSVGGEYVEGMIGSPKYVNPLMAAYNDVDRDLTSLVFNGLMKVNREGIIEPDLAESYEISGDRKVYTFKIKSGINWHDGEPFKIDDIVFTINSIQDPEWQTQLKSALGNVQVEKIDDQTVSFSLREPVNNFINSLTFGILPEHKWFNIPSTNATLAELNKKPIGTGPYKFDSLTKDKNGNIKTYALARNEDYYAQAPYIKKLIFKFYGDYETAANALANKNIQGLNLLPKEFQDKVAKNKQLAFYHLSLPQYTAVFFNPKKNEALKEVKVRQAMAYAIDRQKILEQALNQQGEIIDGPILPGFIGYHANIKKYGFDPGQAEKLLEEAGWMAEVNTENNSKIRRKSDQILQLTLTTVEKQEYTAALDKIKENLQSIGVTVKISIIPKEKIRSDVIENRNYEALLFGEIIKSDPYPFWHSTQAAAPGANLAVWANREVDQMLEEARISANTEEINQKYVRFQDILAENVPAIFLYNPINIYRIDKKIKGVNLKRISVPSDRFLDLPNWYIKSKSKFSWKSAEENASQE